MSSKIGAYPYIVLDVRHFVGKFRRNGYFAILAQKLNIKLDVQHELGLTNESSHAKPSSRFYNFWQAQASH